MPGAPGVLAERAALRAGDTTLRALGARAARGAVTEDEAHHLAAAGAARAHLRDRLATLTAERGTVSGTGTGPAVRDLRALSDDELLRLYEESAAPRPGQ
jgi:hypothetical protein